MASQDPFLTNWVRNAYSMEIGLIPVLERQAQAVADDQQLQQGINHHLQATRRHAQLMKDCLQRLGDSTTGIQPAEPVVAPFARADGGGPNATFHTELLDYVTEHYEVAAYRALAILAGERGDSETVRACEQILRDETAMVNALGMRLPESGTSGAAGQAPERGVETEAVRIARASFDALNAQDLNRYSQFEADDCQIESPGASGPMNRHQERDYLEGLLGAFPDGKFEITRCISEKNDVALGWIATGTNTLELRTPQGQTIPPSHKRVRLPGSTTLEIKDGKIQRGWNYWDLSSLLEQMGVSRHV